MIKPLIIISIMIATSFSAVSCQTISKDKEMDAFAMKKKQAQEFIRNKDFQNAEQYYLSAMKIAEKTDWTDGVIMTKIGLSQVYIGKRDIEKAEMELSEAKDICEHKKDCSAGQLASVYDSSFNLYLFWVKDDRKALEIANEAIEFRQKLSESENVRDILSAYVRKLKLAGFEKEAFDLESRIKSL